MNVWQYDVQTGETKIVEVPDEEFPIYPDPETDEISNDEALAIIMGGAT